MNKHNYYSSVSLIAKSTCDMDICLSFSNSDVIFSAIVHGLCEELQVHLTQYIAIDQLHAAVIC